jgi:iron-sulfur cluster repair protein YtfE (RIC family)
MARKAAQKRTVKRTAAKKGTRRTARAKTARRKTAARAAASRSSKKTGGRTTAKKKASAGAKKKTAPPRSRVAAAAASAAGRVRGAVAGAVQRVTGSFPWSADENDPLALLESDHRRFEDLLKQGEATTERAINARTTLLNTLTAALNVHELIEEKVLYPALKPHSEARDVVLEGFEEHHVADVIVKELHELATDNERWGAKFKVLQESIEHHIEEEENVMFPAARRVLSADELQQLGARMRTLKAQAERGRPTAPR